MSKPEIKVTCFFKDEGEAVGQIIIRSFGLFLQLETARDEENFELTAQTRK